jgi:hypothetical protein
MGQTGPGATSPCTVDAVAAGLAVKCVNNQENCGAAVARDEVEMYSEDELMDAFEDEVKGDEVASPVAMQLRELAAILEAETLSHKSKRRASTGDEHSLGRAERIKAARNLDFTKEKDNNSSPHTSFIHFSNECVVDNLKIVGISLGNNLDHIASSVSLIKQVELERLKGISDSRDRISEIFDKEEKEEMENEEVDKIILTSLCCKIMDEVMDLGNAYM